MEIKLKKSLLIAFLLISCNILAQDVNLYQQFAGRYDFVFFGNTLNMEENGLTANCTILTASSADLVLNPGDNILKAYLYWAGSGPGDFDVKLNGQDITADRTFGVTQLLTNRPFFSAFKDVTAQVSASGPGTYTLSDLDVSAVIPEYCTNGTNFAGWAIVVIYQNPVLPLNQINVYDGLQRIPNDVNITLDNLNVIDNTGAKIGFVAWEGDRFIDNAEYLFFNNHLVGNPPLNPSDNAFNGTNSFTGATNLYNMDLDVYDIQPYLAIGDDHADISLTSGQDFVMINTVVTKLNSQLPDATIAIDNIAVACSSRNLDVDYTVFNIASSQQLPGQTPIAFYVNGQLVGQSQTQNDIDINASESGHIAIEVAANITAPFELTAIVDDNGQGAGTVIEIDETNNTSLPVAFAFPELPLPNPLPVLYSCNEGLTTGTFNLSSYIGLASNDPGDTVTFYETPDDAQSGDNAITDTAHYQAPSTPATLFVRVDNATCFAVISFELKVRNCPPTVYNYISANNDGINDDFFIKGLRDIFLNFKLSVYNRWGRLVWTGNNNLPNWTGVNNEGYIPINGNTPDGTYYYILELNDPDYPEPLCGFLYLNR